MADVPVFVSVPVLYVAVVAPDISVQVLPLLVLNCHSLEVTQDEPECVKATEPSDSIVLVAGVTVPGMGGGLTVITDSAE